MNDLLKQEDKELYKLLRETALFQEGENRWGKPLVSSYNELAKEVFELLKKHSVGAEYADDVLACIGRSYNFLHTIMVENVKRHGMSETLRKKLGL